MGTHTSKISDEFRNSRGEASYRGMEKPMGAADERNIVGNGTQGFLFGDIPKVRGRGLFFYTFYIIVEELCH